MSTTIPDTNQIASHAVDNIIDCSDYLLIAHSDFEFQPWLKIDLKTMYDVKKVIIHNRYDCCGKYLEFQKCIYVIYDLTMS